jgi:hypothetical protein
MLGWGCEYQHFIVQACIYEWNAKVAKLASPASFSERCTILNVLYTP